jgi:hypothetical protein
MVNVRLLYSSVFFGALLLYFCHECYSKDNRALIAITLLGVFTSILNHMYTNKMYQYIDRITMVMGFILVFAISVENEIIIPIAGIALSSILYFFSKYTRNNSYHLFAHLFITITIIFLLNKKKKGKGKNFI